MYTKSIIQATLTVLLFFLSFVASAQRTMPGQPAIHLAGFYNGQRPGAEVIFSAYTGNGYWETGVSESPGFARTCNGINIDFLHSALFGGYLFRILATRNRIMNLYCGGGLLTGIESTDPWGSLPSYLDTGLAAHRFLYGIYGRLAGEMFLGNHIALTASGNVPINFSSAFSYVRWNACLGIKLIIR